MEKKEMIKEQILAFTRQYYEAMKEEENEFKPGDRISYAGRCFDAEEMVNLVDSSLEFWLTSGRYTKQFEKNFSEFLDVKYCSLVNSGSSANLLAFMTLTSYQLGERRIKKGDEVITVAAAFPTTVAPIMQYGAIPVFVDVTIPQYNIDVSFLEQAYTEKTKAVMIAHTLGNPFDIQAVRDFCDSHQLWLIEDNCDALGSEYKYHGKWMKTGTVGDIATSSFYPPHHITMGEGGAVYTNNARLHKICRSLRDWGRDCSCETGQDNRCQKRFSGKYGQLPVGYDHKYVYSHLGYNLKATDMQAAIGCAQLEKINDFTKCRRENWQLLTEELQPLRDSLILPQQQNETKPSWFGYMITVSEHAKFTRDELVSYLENHNIQTRNLFAGNIIKHPCFDEFRDNESVYRVVGELPQTEDVMKRTFWIGVYPNMTKEKILYMANIIKEFVAHE